MIILAIETSCDETACAIVSAKNGEIKILSNVVSSQIKLHAKWGGVVPNLAAREHLKNINPVIETSLNEAGLTFKDIDVIGTTNGPGLIPALLIGVNAAKTLAYVWQKPLLGIHHIEGHIYANFISDKISSISNSKFLISKKIKNTKTTNHKLPTTNQIKFPVLCLVVSGGHTQLVLMKEHLQYEIIGQTLDDAAGEAFDKVARILGIGYPGGPMVSKHATGYKIQDTKYKIQFPRPMLSKNNFDFSFSGLKTAVLYETKKHPSLLKNKSYVAAVCHEFQQASIDVLIAKTLKAAEKHRPKTIMLAGGVSANTELRKQLGIAITKFIPNTKYCIPAPNLTGDNAAMIAAATFFRFQKMSETQKKSTKENWKKITADANLKM